MTYGFPPADELMTDDWELMLRGRGMSCEVEFMPVGTGSRPGDAIIVRYGTPTVYHLILIDGGDAASGENIVTHIRQHFGSNAYINHMVLTHSDMDHASGLREVLRQVRVLNLWLHIPWLHARQAIGLFQDKRWTADGLEAHIRDQYDVISEIVRLAREQRANIYHPFTGADVGPFRVMSPTEYNYLHLLPQFDRTPAPDIPLLQASGMWLGYSGIRSAASSLVDRLMARVQRWLPETWMIEHLRDGGVTSPSNETSVILYGVFSNAGRILLTGDAGINALTWAADYATARGHPLQQFACVQVPHHGSRRNVGPTILDRVVGPVQPAGTQTFNAYISAPPNDDTHPRRMVVNAFTRRGARVYATQGVPTVFWGGFMPRLGYIPATPLVLSPEVDDYD